jgi:HEPN domain-containing protein
MPHEKVVPGSAEDWINHAESDLALAMYVDFEGVMPEALCFHVQQAVEKA